MLSKAAVAAIMGAASEARNRERLMTRTMMGIVTAVVAVAAGLGFAAGRYSVTVTQDGDGRSVVVTPQFETPTNEIAMELYRGTVDPAAVPGTPKQQTVEIVNCNQEEVNVRCSALIKDRPEWQARTDQMLFTKKDGGQWLWLKGW